MMKKLLKLPVKKINKSLPKYVDNIVVCLLKTINSENVSLVSDPVPGVRI